MSRPRIVVAEELAGTWRNHRALTVRAGELNHCPYVGELRHRKELDFIVGGVAPQEISARIAPDTMDSGQNFSPKERLVLVRVFTRSPAVPDSADHLDLVPRITAGCLPRVSSVTAAFHRPAGEILRGEVLGWE